MEHFRYKDHTEEVHHFVDTQLCVIMDTVTGELIRFGKDRSLTGTFEEAKEYMFLDVREPSRDIIISFNCMRSFLIEKRR